MATADPVRWARRGLLLLIAAQTLVGLTWVTRNLGDLPEYVDSLEYIRASRSLQVDSFRGIAYPLFLAAVDRLVGGEGLEATETASAERGRTQGRRVARARPGNAFVPSSGSGQAIVLQLAQLAIVAGSLVYFLRTFVAPLGAGNRGALAFLLLLLLLCADPLVAHLQLAVLTDGLALSAALVFCASLVRSLFSQHRRILSGTALFLSALLTSSLRAEKAWVLLGTLFGSFACWWLWERRRAAGERSFSPRRALQTAGIALAGVLVSLAVQHAFRGESKRLPPYEFILDQRILFPHLSAVYPELPAEVRAYLTSAQASEHDQDVVLAWRGIEGLGGGDPELRHALMESAARVVLRERWHWITLDVFRDAAENALVPLSFYGHLGVLACIGGKRYGIIPGDYNRWTYMQMSLYHPRTTQLHLALSGLSFALCSVLALVHVRSRRKEGAPRVARTWRLAWVPVGVFVLANACAFALTTGLVHPRYAVLAHAVLLVLVYRGALGWAAEESRTRAAT